MPADQEPPPYEVRAALVMSLRGKMADAVACGAGLVHSDLCGKLRQ